MRYPGNEPCPRPGEMVLVTTRQGKYWRAKRSKAGNKAAMNKGMKAGAELVKLLMPAAARFVDELRPYMLHMDPERIVMRVKGCLHRSIKEKGEPDYSYMEGLDFQPQYPVWQLMKNIRPLTRDGNDVVMYIPIPNGGAVKALNTFITGYRFSLIMVVGDPIKDKLLRTYDVSSPRYETGQAVEEGCELRMPRPDEGEKWICIFSITSYQGKALPENGRHYGMKVVGWDSKQMLEYEVERMAMEGAMAVMSGKSAGVNEVADDTYTESAGIKPGSAGVNGKSAGVNMGTSAGVNSVIEQVMARTRADLRQNVRAVAMAIYDEPGMRLPEIALKTDLSARSLERHIKHLKETGLIEYRGSAKKGGYFLSYEYGA